MKSVKAIVSLTIIIVLSSIILSYAFAQEGNLSKNNRVSTITFSVLAFLSSFFIVTLIWITTTFVLKKYAAYVLEEGTKWTFWDIIRIKDNYPNLGVFQFLMWSVVIFFCSLGFYLFVIFLVADRLAKIQDVLQIIPYNLFTLMGISAVSCIISIYLARDKYSTPRPPPKAVGVIEKRNSDRKGSLISEMILEENHKMSLPKLQMFFWTWILIIIYFIAFFLQTFEIVVDVEDDRKINNLQAINIPDIHPAFVIIMAVSQGAFIGNSLMSQRTIRIIYVVPARHKVNEIISIFGTNFGSTLEKGAIWIEFGDVDRRIRIPDESIMLWSDDRIEIKISEETSKKISEASGKNGKPCYRVVSAGRITDPYWLPYPLI